MFKGGTHMEVWGWGGEGGVVRSITGENIVSEESRITLGTGVLRTPCVW